MELPEKIIFSKNDPIIHNLKIIKLINETQKKIYISIKDKWNGYYFFEIASWHKNSLYLLEHKHGQSIAQINATKLSEK